MPIRSRHSPIGALLLAALIAVRVAAQAPAQPAPAAAAPVVQERGPQVLSPEAVKSSIDALGTVDASANEAAYAARMNASRALRRAPADTVVPALMQAVENHRDSYVRFRALVLLTAFNDPRTSDLVKDMIENPNDRLRTVSYAYYEHHPSASVIPALLQALEREESEFVRPALIRALAAQGSDARVRQALLRDVGRGQDFFRSAVIEALGDYRAAYAFDPLVQIAKVDGPLQIDAIVALGKLKDPRAMETLATLQRSAPRETQPALAASICLIGVNCDVHVPFLVQTLKFAQENQGFQALLRNTVAGLVALANTGNVTALTALFDAGVQSIDPARAPIALGAGTVAIRNATLVLSFFETYPKRDQAIDLVAEGFDMLEEDYAEESFFAAVRRGYWQAAEGSATRKVGQTLIEKLEF